MNQPMELSIAEIRKYMQENGCKVTNHALVKHFKRFLTQPATQNEARKQFKTYVNILATIKNENNQKYLILRKKYLTQCPTDEMVERAVVAEANDAAPSSPGGGSIVSESSLASPFRQPPPYKPPPEVTSPKASACIASGSVNEAGISVPSASFSQLLHQCSDGIAGSIDSEEPVVERRLKSISRENSVENSNSKELIPRFSFSSGASATSADSSGGEKVSSSEGDITDNPISVKEATRKFNRLASEEEAKLISPPSKKKVDNQALQEKEAPEVTLAHPKSKEWVVTMAKGNYQELFKLAKDYPELVKLQDPTTGFTALHWAAKHGNEDVVKLIAGRYKADVHARTNGGYTPLHVAMQFGRVNIFELLCNTYKANRDVMDWSGNKPLDYSKQSTSVSPSTYSKIKARRKHTAEKDLGFLRIGSLNVRVKKTTEAFSNFLGVGNGNGNAMAPLNAGNIVNSSTASLTHQRPHRHHHHHLHHHHAGMTRNHHLHPRTMKTPLGMTNHQLASRSSVPISSSKFEVLHKTWGSADNIPHSADNKDSMPPPKNVDIVRKRQRSAKRASVSSNATDSPRDSISSNSSSNLNTGYSSMPTTPNQLRAPISIGMCVVDPSGDSDSDSACGFGSNWSVNGRSGSLQAPRFP